MAHRSQSLAQHYHERTKYDPETIQAKQQPFDWSQQPSLFKEYKIGRSLDLKPYLLEAQGHEDPVQHWWQRLSQLLYCSYGLTAIIPGMEEPYYLRAAPSAGGLYPSEIYLISRGIPNLGAGLYHYQSRGHALWQYWESDVWTKLQSACFWHPTLEQTQLALVVTAVFERSVWRYQDRAYRRICLDMGHLLGNLELAGSICDYRPHLIGSFADEAVNQLMYLDPEREGVLAVLPLADLLEVKQNLPLARTTTPELVSVSGVADPQGSGELANIPDGALLSALHQATQIPYNAQLKVSWKLPPPDTSAADKYNFSFCLKVSTLHSGMEWGADLEQLQHTLIKRRSTREYTGGPIRLDELKAVLDFTYQPQHYTEQHLDGCPDYFALDWVQTFVTAVGVEGLEDGCYYYAPKAQELRQIRFKNFRQELYFLCLGQELGRDAAAAVFHTADLSAAVQAYGDRIYRYLHLDAGHLGQRLNLAAIHLGLGVSGIGGFFDDQVNEVLGIPTDEAVLYITTLGCPQPPQY
jgi:SagB-type dehydrogenase family enzyme